MFSKGTELLCTSMLGRDGSMSSLFIFLSIPLLTLLDSSIDFSRLMSKASSGRVVIFSRLYISISFLDNLDFLEKLSLIKSSSVR